MSGLGESSAVGASVTGSGLGQRFDVEWLFRDLSFVVRPGQVTAVCGPSGSGKSTLLAIIAGWLKPVEGVVACAGVDRIGWVFQNPYGVAVRTALDHVVFPLVAQGMDARAAEAAAGELLDLFHLGHTAQRPFGTLSGGEAQRLMLARAVASHPDVLLVDEPTAQLDRVSAGHVNETIGSIASQGSIVIIASHDPDTVRHCDQVIDLGEAHA